jgi:hypothetical protein
MLAAEEMSCLLGLAMLAAALVSRAARVVR